MPLLPVYLCEAGFEHGSSAFVSAVGVFVFVDYALFSS